MQLELTDHRDHVARLDAHAQQFVACCQRDFANSGGVVILLAERVQVALEDVPGQFGVHHQPLQRSELRAQEQPVLALRLGAVAGAGLLGEISILDREAQRVHPGSIEAESSRCGIAAAYGAGKKRLGQKQRNGKCNHAHEYAPIAVRTDDRTESTAW